MFQEEEKEKELNELNEKEVNELLVNEKTLNQEEDFTSFVNTLFETKMMIDLYNGLDEILSEDPVNEVLLEMFAVNYITIVSDINYNQTGSGNKKTFKRRNKRIKPQKGGSNIHKFNIVCLFMIFSYVTSTVFHTLQRKGINQLIKYGKVFPTSLVIPRQSKVSQIKKEILNVCRDGAVRYASYYMNFRIKAFDSISGTVAKIKPLASQFQFSQYFLSQLYNSNSTKQIEGFEKLSLLPFQQTSTNPLIFLAVLKSANVLLENFSLWFSTLQLAEKYKENKNAITVVVNSVSIVLSPSVIASIKLAKSVNDLMETILQQNPAEFTDPNIQIILRKYSQYLARNKDQLPNLFLPIISADLATNVFENAGKQLVETMVKRAGRTLKRKKTK
jgi:hypothetical protein